MANVLTTCTINTHENELYTENKNIKFFDTQFSEQDVLELQELCVTFGIHCIKTKDVQSGRHIMQTILRSLKHFQNIGAITNTTGLPDFASDILVDIKMQGFCSHDIFLDLENFFTIHAYFDFIWIECTGDLQFKNFDRIKNIFEMYHAQDQMPVIFILYEQEK